MVMSGYSKHCDFYCDISLSFLKKLAIFKHLFQCVMIHILYFSYLCWILGKRKLLSHVIQMLRTNFRSPYPCRLHAVFGFDHDWVNKSVLFYSIHRRNTKKIIWLKLLFLCIVANIYTMTILKVYTIICTYKGDLEESFSTFLESVSQIICT